MNRTFEWSARVGYLVREMGNHRASFDRFSAPDIKKWLLGKSLEEPKPLLHRGAKNENSGFS